MDIYSDAAQSSSQQESDMEKIEDDLKKSAAAENFRILDNLYRSQEWQWFRSNVLDKAVEEQRDIALDDTRTRKERDRAVYRHSFGVELLDKLSQQRIMWAAQAGIKLS